MISSPPLSAMLKANGKTTIHYGFLLVAIGVVIIAILASSSIFTVLLSPLLPNQQSAFGTFLGENGRIAFYRYIGATAHIFTMNADGSDQMDLSNNHYDWAPDWSPDGTKIAG